MPHKKSIGKAVAVPASVPTHLEYHYRGTHPFLVFWLGLITGALIVSLGFGYLFYQSQTIQKTIEENVK